MIREVAFLEGHMTPSDRRVDINMSGIRVSGIGGLGMVAMAAWVSIVMPEAWFTTVLGLVGGLLLGVALIAYRRHHVSSAPSGDDPAILFRTEPERSAPAAHPRPTDVVRLASL
jgi:hypothetical protein